jgi:hypothetical protein
MNKELYKQLREAGFEGLNSGCHECDGDSLSNLIKACGKEFATIMKSGTNWLVMSVEGINEVGSTPEEAVANLWLELQKNKKN